MMLDYFYGQSGEYLSGKHRSRCLYCPGVIAAGVPCKVIRPITEKDKFKPEDILF